MTNHDFATEPLKNQESKSHTNFILILCLVMLSLDLALIFHCIVVMAFTLMFISKPLMFCSMLILLVADHKWSFLFHRLLMRPSRSWTL